MTYSRREVVDNETVVDKDHYDNLQDGIDEALKGNKDAKSYTDQQIALVTSTGIPKLVIDVQPIVAESEGQTEFEITLETYDERTDSVLFFSGLTKLSPNKDYTVEGNKVILKRGLPKGRTGDIYIFKNVPMGEDGSVTGKVLAQGTIPLDRLEKMPTASDVGALKVYTSLSELGLSESTATAEAIAKAMANNSMLIYQSGGNATTSALTLPFNHGLVRVIKSNNNYTEFHYQGLSLTNKSNTVGMPYIGYFNEASGSYGKWSGWIDVADASKFLPLDGSVAMSGSTFGLYDNRARIVTSDGALAVEIRNDNTTTTNHRRLRLFASNIAGLSECMKILDTVDGSGKQYVIFGEHNKELLASTIQSLIESGAISVPAVKSIQRGVINTSGSTKTATATISTVDVSKSIVIYTGTATDYNLGYMALTLVDSTTVKAERKTADCATSTPYQVIEFY